MEKRVEGLKRKRGKGKEEGETVEREEEKKGTEMRIKEIERKIEKNERKKRKENKYNCEGNIGRGRRNEQEKKENG